MRRFEGESGGCLHGSAHNRAVSIVHQGIWVHEGGGISGYERWYGPFDLDE